MLIQALEVDSLAKSLHKDKGIRKEGNYFNFRLDFSERNFNHVNEFVCITRLLQSRKDKIPIKSIQGFYSDFHTHPSFHE